MRIVREEDYQKNDRIEVIGCFPVIPVLTGSLFNEFTMDVTITNEQDILVLTVLPSEDDLKEQLMFIDKSEAIKLANYILKSLGTA